MDLNDLSQGSGFSVIENPEVIQLLKALYVGDNPKSPVIFGSMTSWKVYKMLQTEVYTLIQVKDDLLRISFNDIR